MPLHRGGQIAEAIRRGVGFLREQQLANGEFRSCHSPAGTRDGYWAAHPSPFVTTLVVDSLGSLPDAGLEAMRSRALGYLRSQQMSDGLCRYMDGLDPDADTTSCVAFALESTGDPARPIARDRLLANRNPRGLFYTWFRVAKARNDVDSAVNANVLLHLGENDETRVVCDYLVGLVNRDEESHSYWYYDDDLALYYFMSRAFRNGARSLSGATESIASKIDARTVDSSLWAALAIATLANFESVTPATAAPFIDRILSDQGSDGSWPVAAFMRNAGPGLMLRRPAMSYSGSEELTTAFCIEALSRMR